MAQPVRRYSLYIVLKEDLTMPRTRLGFDIGNSSVKIAAVFRGRLRMYEIRLPDNMIRDGEIVMPNAFSAFLKKERKRLKLPKGECALVLPARQVICRTITMPGMTREQLMLNLPYEFSDFIEGDPDRFFCDYAMCREDPPEAEETGKTEEREEQMTMMAAVTAKETIAGYLRMFSGAGLKLKMLLPPEMALIHLIRNYRRLVAGSPQEYCFINLGQNSTSITVIKNDRVQAARQIEFGCGRIDMAIADQLNVDPFLANSYKYTNYQDVMNSPECMEIYQSITVEILKVINFYQFNYRDNQLAGVYLTGGGASITQLRERIQDMVGLPVLPLEELLPGEHMNPGTAAKGILAVGVVRYMGQKR